jgi:hypothetical protein
MDEKTFWSKLGDLKGSVKFWTMALGVFVVVIKTFFPDLAISDAQINDLVLLLAAFIVGRGLENVGSFGDLVKLIAPFLVSADPATPDITASEKKELEQK